MLNVDCFLPQYWANQQPERTAVIWNKGSSPFFPQLQSQSMTWSQLNKLITQISDKFRGNVTKNNIIAYCGESRFCGLLSYLAVIALGGRIVMLNPALKTSQKNAILTDIGVDFLITDQDFLSLENINNLGSVDDDNVSQALTLTLTSGSSGKPKAVVHTVADHLANAKGVCELMAFSHTDSWLLSLPLFHVSGQGIIWRWLLQGATLQICEDKCDFMDGLDEVSHASLVPTQLQRYLEQRQQPLAKPKSILLGGAFIPPELVELAKKRNIVTFSGYGMTEMASTICAGRNESHNVGYPLLGREVRLVNQEIWVKGAGLAQGIWQKNGEIRPLVNAEGWLQTKDKGEWNAKHQLIVLGRLDNMFISGGENIQPEEIEQQIYSSNLVSQAFVLPIDDKEFGARPVAFIQFKENHFETESTKLQCYLAEKLEKFKQPIRYFPLDIAKWQAQGTIKISRTLLQQHLIKLLEAEKTI